MKTPLSAELLEAAACALVLAFLCSSAWLLILRGDAGFARYQRDILLRIDASSPEASTHLVRDACVALGGKGLAIERTRGFQRACAGVPVSAADRTQLRADLDSLHARLDQRRVAIERSVGQLLRVPRDDAQALTEGYSTAPGEAGREPEIDQQRAAALTRLESIIGGQLDRVRITRQAYDLEALRVELAPAERRYAAALAGGNLDAAAAELWQLAQTLQGRSGLAGGRMVQRWLSSVGRAETAELAQKIVRGAPWLLVIWGAWLVVMVRLGRRSASAMSPVIAAAAAAGVHLVIAAAMRIPVPTIFWWLAGALSVLGLAGWVLGRLGWTLRPVNAVPASPWLVPGWLLVLGIGWLVTADLSLGFDAKFRFDVVHHYHDLTAAMLVLCAVAPLAATLATAAVATYRWLFTRRVSCRLCLVAQVGAWAAIAGAVAYLATRGLAHITGEIFKAVLIVASAAFLAMRGAALVEAGTLTAGRRFPDHVQAADLLRMLLPLVTIVSMAAAGLLVSTDLGPLLVMGVALAVLLGGFAGMWWTAVAVIVIGAAVYVAQWPSETVAERIALMSEPFAAPRDDVARLLWFQSEAPLIGFGPGLSPWCGYHGTETCVGLPEQTRSDYTVTALAGIWGVFGWLFVWVLAGWSIVLMRAWSATPTQPEALLGNARAPALAFLAWLALVFGVLVTVQTAVTLAGNVRWIPLTGITLPFASWGTTALLIFTTLFALVVNRERTQA